MRRQHLDDFYNATMLKIVNSRIETYSKEIRPVAGENILSRIIRKRQNQSDIT